MLENLKWYLVNIGLKKYAPIGAMAALGAIGAFMAAHAGMLEQYGITYSNWPFIWPTGSEPTGPCLLIEMDTLSKAAIAGIVGLIAMVMRATEHHVATTITPPVPGGLRAADPPSPSA